MTAPRIDPVHAVLVDDEPLALRTLKRLVARDGDFVVDAACRRGTEAVTAIRRHAPDVVLLDVEMPVMSGLGVLDALEATPLPVIVFVTAHNIHMQAAFDAHALDYVLKPFSDDRFALALARAKARVVERRAAAASPHFAHLVDANSQSPATALVPAAPEWMQRFMIRRDGRVTFVKTQDTDWIEADDYYAKLHVGAGTHLVRETMLALERRLDHGQFVRIHRTAIVNLDRIRELRLQFKGQYTVVLTDGTELPVGRARRARLEAALLKRK